MDQIARTPKQIGAALKRERSRRSLTQKDLGAKIKLRQATISNLEAGKSATRLQTFLDALAALNLEIVIRPRSRALPEEMGKIF
jgi:HTH-type transcriptional regulator/antitoxin HipB